MSQLRLALLVLLVDKRRIRAIHFPSRIIHLLAFSVALPIQGPFQSTLDSLLALL